MTEKQDRRSDAMEVVESASSNPARSGQRLDIRIVGPGLSITLMSIEDFKVLVASVRTWKDAPPTP